MGAQDEAGSGGPAGPTKSESKVQWIALRALPAFALALVALWELGATLLPGSAAAPGDWRVAAALVRERAEAGDLIVFAPSWIDPVGRKHLGDRMPLAMAARMDAARYGVIWELSVRGARAAETRGLSATFRKSFGAVSVRRYEQEPATVVYDFVEEAGSAVASRGRWRASLEEVGFAPHRCIKVVPAPDETISLRFPAAVLGSEIVGYVGLADVFTRRDVRDPGRLELWIHGQKRATVLAGVDDGWVRFAATTEAESSASVEFRLTAVGPQARDRRICFAAEARR